MNDWRARWGVKPRSAKRSGRCKCGRRTNDGRTRCYECKTAGNEWHHSQTALGYFIGLYVYYAVNDHVPRGTNYPKGDLHAQA